MKIIINLLINNIHENLNNSQLSRIVIAISLFLTL